MSAPTDGVTAGARRLHGQRAVDYAAKHDMWLFLWDKEKGESLGRTKAGEVGPRTLEDPRIDVYLEVACQECYPGTNTGVLCESCERISPMADEVWQCMKCGKAVGSMLEACPSCGSRMQVRDPWADADRAYAEAKEARA